MLVLPPRSAVRQASLFLPSSMFGLVRVGKIYIHVPEGNFRVTEETEFVYAKVISKTGVTNRYSRRLTAVTPPTS
jgi:hypothetical protein